jgi:hypothetical protein
MQSIKHTQTNQETKHRVWDFLNAAYFHDGKWYPFKCRYRILDRDTSKFRRDVLKYDESTRKALVIDQTVTVNGRSGRRKTRLNLLIIADKTGVDS